MEKGINIRAAEYRFEDKKLFYIGFTNDKGTIKAGTRIQELKGMAEKEDFTEQDIIDRKTAIIEGFIKCL